jgi:DNA repair protein RadC
VKGLGNAKYAQLQAVLEMARRHTFEELDRGDVLTVLNSHIHLP